MPTTPYIDSGFVNTVSGGTFKVQVRTEYGTPTRVNNTVTINGVRAGARAVHVSGTNYAQLWSVGVKGLKSQLPSGTQRASTVIAGNGTYMNRDQNYWGASTNQTITVDKDANTTTVRQAFRRSTSSSDNGSDNWGAVQTISIPALGAPTGVTASATNITPTTVTLNASVSGWGTNATAGTGQRIEWKKSADPTWTNEAYSTSTSHSLNKTGLDANTKYDLRSYALNGGGKPGSSSTSNFVTLAQATETSKDVQATSATFEAAVTQGEYTTNTKVQYRAVGSGTWLDSSSHTGGTPTIMISGLAPATDYEYRYVVTTTAGVYTGPTRPLNTIPAGKLVMPNGDVVNAVPSLVYPNGDVKLININIIEP